MNNDVARMKLCREQEKEIERLRESLEIAENAYDLLANTHNQQAAEIERLRERCNEWAGRCGTSDGKRLLMQPVIDAAWEYRKAIRNKHRFQRIDQLGIKVDEALDAYHRGDK